MEADEGRGRLHPPATPAPAPGANASEDEDDAAWLVAEEAWSGVGGEFSKSRRFRAGDGPLPAHTSALQTIASRSCRTTKRKRARQKARGQKEKNKGKHGAGIEGILQQDSDAMENNTKRERW